MVEIDTDGLSYKALMYIKDKGEVYQYKNHQFLKKI